MGPVVDQLLSVARSQVVHGTDRDGQDRMATIGRAGTGQVRPVACESSDVPPTVSGRASTVGHPGCLPGDAS